MTRFPFAIVRSLSKIDEYDEWTMSLETIGSSVYWRIPSRSPVSAVRAEELVDLLGRRLRADLDDEVDDRADRDRRTHRHAVDLPLEVGEHDPDRAGGARRGRDEVDRGGPGAAQVLVREVEGLLVVRVRVDRRHEAALDPVRLVQDLGDRRDAVRRAGGVRDDVMLLRVVLAVVDAEDDREVRVGGRSGDDDLLGTRLEVLLRVGALREQAGRLDRDVDAEIRPGEVGRVALRDELDLVAVDGDRVVTRLDRDVEIAEDGVVLEQVRHRLRVADVVRGHDLEVAAVLELGAQEVPADAAEAVDPHPGLRHLGAPLVVGLPIESNRACAGEIRSSPQSSRGSRAGWRADREAPRTTLPVPHPLET